MWNRFHMQFVLKSHNYHQLWVKHSLTKAYNLLLCICGILYSPTPSLLATHIRRVRIWGIVSSICGVSIYEVYYPVSSVYMRCVGISGIVSSKKCVYEACQYMRYSIQYMRSVSISGVISSIWPSVIEETVSPVLLAIG